MSTCARCGRTYDHQEGRIIAPDKPPVELCHPNDPALPDCYHLVTVYGDWGVHDHAERCCREHGTHSMPHKGCIFR